MGSDKPTIWLVAHKFYILYKQFVEIEDFIENIYKL